MYDRYWDNWYLPAALPALELLLFSQLREGDSVLDVCCGSGHVTGEIVRRGYQVTGIDQSAALIGLARQRVPAADFHVQDVRAFRPAKAFGGALSTFDALNHLLTLSDLQSAFDSVFGALRSGGVFVFDMNLDTAYTLDLRHWNANVDEDSVSLTRGTFEPATQLASTELVWLVRLKSGLWERNESIVHERCYQTSTIVQALNTAGFDRIEAAEARDCGVSTDLAFGRMFFRCWRP